MPACWLLSFVVYTRNCVWQLDEYRRVACLKLSIFSAGNRQGIDKTHPSDQTTKKKNNRSKAPEMNAKKMKILTEIMPQTTPTLSE